MSVSETPVVETTAPAATVTVETGRDGQPFDAERAQRTIDKQRDELKAAKAQAAEADALRAKVQEFENAGRSESERKDAELATAARKLADAEQRVADAEARHQAALVNAAIDREAHKQGAVDPEAVAAMIDRSALTLGEDGAVKGAEAAVKKLLEAKPYLAGQASGTAPAGGFRSIPSTPKPAAPAGRADLIRQEQDALRSSGRYAV